MEDPWKELESKLGKEQIEKAILSLQNEMEIYRNEVLEEVARSIETGFSIPFGEDTVASFASYIRGLKRETQPSEYGE